MAEPLVSIVIPCFNAESTIERTIRSITLEGYRNYEVVLIDDGSTDNTRMILKRLTQGDRRLKFYHQENSGVSSARNKGVQMASSELIAFLDADDIVFKKSISKRANIFVEHDDEDLIGVFCPAFLLGEDLYPLQVNAIFNYSSKFLLLN